jgi:hypothetical protein
MRRTGATVVALLGLTLACTGLASDAAPAPDVIGGGLTALPPVVLGPDLLRHGDFEAREDGNAAWTAAPGWTLDRRTTHDGAASYRRAAGAPSVAQPVTLPVGTYTLSAWVKTEGAGDGLGLALDARPVTREWHALDIPAGTRDWTRYTIPNIVLERATAVRVVLRSERGAAGSAWFDDVRLQAQEPPALDVFLRHPNFRGMLFDDDAPTLMLDVGVRAADPARYAVRATLAEDGAGTPLDTRTFAAAPRLVAALDGASMRPGRAYLVTVELVDRAAGTVLFTHPAHRVSRVPAARRAAMPLAVDARNRLLVRGVPRFLLGLYDGGPGSGTTDGFWEERLWSPTGARRLGDLAINFYLNPWLSQAPAGAVRALAGNLARHGVTYVHTAGCFGTVPAGAEVGLDVADGEPLAPGYYTADECPARRRAAVFAHYDDLRRRQPAGLTLAVHAADGAIDLWRDTTDVLGSDPFPLAGADTPPHPAQVAEWTEIARAAVHDARPVVTVLQFFPSPVTGRFPTRAELRDQAYMAIVAGARGLWWWSLGTSAAASCADGCPPRAVRLDDLRAVVGELAALEPVLLADDAPAALTTVSSARIHTRIKRHAGRGYVFAYNAGDTATRATFTWSTAPGAVTVGGEGRSLPVRAGAFSDTFAPYQAHVYIIANGGTD